MSTRARQESLLADVIGEPAGYQGFTPQHPERPPWVQPSGRPVDVAVTGHVATVPLIVADRVHLHGLDRRLATADPMEMLPEDHTRRSWGVAP